MKVITCRSRKLFLLLAFISVDFSPILTGGPSFQDGLMGNEPLSWPSENGTDNESSKEATQLGNDYYPVNGDSVWITDKDSNQCLGLHGFSQCSDLSTWVWLQTEKGIKLKSHDSVDSLCLGWKSWSKAIEIMPCDVDSANILRRSVRHVHWNYDSENSQLQAVPTGISSVLPGSRPYCIATQGFRLQPCASTTSQLVFQKNGLEPLQSKTEEEEDISSERIIRNNEAVIPDTGFWQCPTTGQSLPRNLDNYFQESNFTSEGRQVLMGAGLFSKVVFGMNFHVFNIGWYVDAAAAQASASLRPFADMTVEQLQSTQEFYDVMPTRGDFDRTMILKLAMNLKKDVVIQGLIDELPLDPDNEKLIVAASNIYPESECSEGTEIVLRWIQARRGVTEERVEIYVGGMLIPVNAHGLGEDFFQYYFRAEHPVSPHGKREFARQFSPLLASNASMYSPSTSTLSEQPAPPRPQKTLFLTRFLTKVLGHDHRELQRIRRLRLHLNSMLLRKRQSWWTDTLITIVVFVYSLLLIAVSLPPAMVESSVRVVKRMKQRSINGLKDMIERTMSHSRSLVNLARPSSLVELARSGSTNFKMYFKLDAAQQAEN